jgi:uncharacterized protein
MTASQAPEQKTMEEILASIRQIISDDEAKSAAREATPGPRPVTAATDRDKVSPLFGLQRAKKPPVEDHEPRRPNAGQEAVDAAIERALGEVGLDSKTRKANPPTSTPTPAVAARSAPPGRESPFRPPEAPRPLLAEEYPPDDEPLPRIVTGAAEHPGKVDATSPKPLLSAQAEQLVGDSFEELAGAARMAGGRPLAALVEQTLRPMLKTWLDENLPTLVERLVREEVERISRERR